MKKARKTVDRVNLGLLAKSAGFTALTKAEKELLRTAPTEEVTFCGPNEDFKDKANNPHSNVDWGDDRTISAKLIRWLLMDPKVKSLIDPSGISVVGAAIPDRISLAFVSAQFPLRFIQCRIPNGIKISGANLVTLDLDGSDVSFVTAMGTTIAEDLFLRDGFHASDEVKLGGAHIGGNVEFDDGYFAKSIAAAGIQVGGAIYLRNVQSKGELQLMNASIGGNLECDGSRLECPRRSKSDGSRNSLNADNAIVKGDVRLRNQFISDGDVGLVGMQISGDLDCSKAQFIGRFNAREIAVRGALFWMDLVNPSVTELNVRDGSVYALRDDAKSWPSKGHLLIEGFVYMRETQKNEPPHSRIEWLSRIEPFSPQPYRQMAKVKRDSGDENAALKILVELEHRQRGEHGSLHLSSEILNWTIGYGYYPLRALGAFSVLAGFSWMIYRRAYVARTITPTEKEAYLVYKKDDLLPPHYPQFSPLIYSVENSLPLVKLGQVDNWRPDPSSPPALVRQPVPFRFKRFLHLIKSPRLLLQAISIATLSPSFLQRYLWIQILLGWILATLFAAGVAGMVHKD
jgi:hypothetical protein